MILRITLILILLVIAYLSLTPAYTVSVGNDKIGHLIAYAALSFNLALLVAPDRKKLVALILVSLTYGIVLEALQNFVPGRHTSMYDILANACGVAIGTAIVYCCGETIRKFLRRAQII